MAAEFSLHFAITASSLQFAGLKVERFIVYIFDIVCRAWLYYRMHCSGVCNSMVFSTVVLSTVMLSRVLCSIVMFSRVLFNTVMFSRVLCENSDVE